MNEKTIAVAEKFLINIQEEVKDCTMILAVNKIDLIRADGSENEKTFKENCSFLKEIE